MSSPYNPYDSVSQPAVLDERFVGGDQELRPNYMQNDTSYTAYSGDAGVADEKQKSRGFAMMSTLKFNQLEQERKFSLVRRFAYIMTGIGLIAIWIGVMLAFARQESKYAQRNKLKDIESINPDKVALVGEPLLKGTLRQFDVDARTLTVQWSALLISQADKTKFIPFGTDDPESGSIEIAIFQDIQAVPDVELEALFAKQNLSDADLKDAYFTNPPFALANRTAKRVGTVGINSWDSFNTDVDLAQAGSGVWEQPLFGYPFDMWSGDIVFVALLPDYANVTNLTGSGVYPISTITIADSILNWQIEAVSNNTCAVASPVNCELHISFTAKRPAIVIFCVMVVVIINWLSTLAIFALTCESVFLRRRHILTEIDILGVCFAALFALPSVRSLLPAAPAFAAIIDLIGILPNVIIISICTTIVAFDRIINRTLEDEEVKDD